MSHAHKEDLGDFATVRSSREQVAGSSQGSPGAHKDMASHLLLRPPQLPFLHYSLCSLPCGWTRSFLSSAWRMRSVSRLSTTTIAEWPTIGTPVRFHSCWWGPRVSASPARVFLKVFVDMVPVWRDLE